MFRAPQSGGQDFHESDLPFWWGNEGDFDFPAPFDRTETLLCHAMRSALLVFVAHGQPGKSAGVSWPLVNNTNGEILLIHTV